MKEELVTRLAGGFLCGISDYCETLEEITAILKEMTALHEEVVKEQNELLGDEDFDT